MILDATLQERGRQMRRNPTEPEKQLWRALSNSQLSGAKFRRQQVIHSYIVDFLCPSRALVIEVDGDTHDAESDVGRDAYLASKGFRVLRFSNADVMGNVSGVLEVLAAAVVSSPERWPHPNPSPEGEGLSEAPGITVGLSPATQGRQ
ncbi:endonuclease domain-containing protein [Sphingomonas prati]|uniref:Very-short-patch-repair endonuclease n=1 Tax=Sphingomonas prati TaxID=1843237 RepID=A0A7W9F2G5_9SPHN|nr:endonuclease domain-containing protein [Sphingomonas prati]MBB5728764.1 very-short-patch-repair endonuclease [Sphingomonas prati]GGE87763.1 DNA methylase [Sphingomonas prati]